VGVVGQVALGHQRGDLLGRQAVAGFHGGAAGHGAQQIVEQRFAARHALLGDEVVHYGLQDGAR
jgi:hypothetical protein